MVSGVICEFNPFHNGHKYLLDCAKSNNSKVICVMSGNFTQRGEIALYEKHIRAKMALKNGADIVISLPTGWSMSGAENFAFGGVSLLKSTGVVDRIVFGCEDDNIDLLLKTAKMLNNNSLIDKIKKNASTGITFAKARENAVKEISPECAEILTKPNNILAVQYINSALNLGFDTDIFPVSRQGVDHDCKNSRGLFASASNIREHILKNDLDTISKYVPENVFSIINSNDHTISSLLDRALLFKLRTLSIDELKKLPDISEGIENRIFDSIKNSDSFEELLSNIKTKRYTMARIRRLLMNAAFGLDNSFINKKPPYIQILGYKNNSKELLSDISKKSDIPLIISTKDIGKLDLFGKKVFESEQMSSDLFSLAFPTPKKSGSELTIPVVKI